MDVLVIAFGILAAIWILVLLGSRFFGPRDPKSTIDSRHETTPTTWCASHATVVDAVLSLIAVTVAMTRGLPITNRIALAEILRDAGDAVERRVLADVD